MGTAEILLFSGIILGACIFQGMVGFGFAFIAVPISLIFFPKSLVVPIMTIISLGLNTYLLWQIKQKLDKGLILRLLAAGLLGMPVGIAILNYVTTWQLKLLAAIISITSILTMTFFKAKFTKKSWVDWGFGWVAGILTTSVNINGAPIAALFIGKQLARDAFRRTLAIYFLGMSLLSLIFFAPQIRNWPTPVFLVPIMAAALIGGRIGHLLVNKVPQRWHKTIAIVTIIVTSLVAVLSK